MRWPLVGVPPQLPSGEGTFGALRRHDVHTGVDLHCAAGTPVVAIEAGTVVAVLPFTGPAAESPWWEPTEAVLVEGASGVVVYGEVAPRVLPGAVLAMGDPIGTVVRVLRHDKGRPTAMLHLELLAPGARDVVWWRHGEPVPPVLRDPGPWLSVLVRGHGVG